MKSKHISDLLKIEAARCLSELGVAVPCLYDFKENDQVYLFDKGEIRRIDPNCIFGKKLKAIETEFDVKVYAVIYSDIEQVGENYAFLCVNPYPEDWAHLFRRSCNGDLIIAYSYVWNVMHDECSEFGSVFLLSMFGKLRRVG